MCIVCTKNSRHIVNICTNYLENSLSDFSEIIPQNSEKCISAHRNFQNFPGSMPPDPVEWARASPRRDRNAITSLGVLESPPPPPRDSNPGSATALPSLLATPNLSLIPH